MGIQTSSSHLNLMSAATDRRILTLLVRMRMSLRRQRRDNSFYHRLAETGENPRVALEAELAELLPPRRDWPRPGTGARALASKTGKDAISIALVEWLLGNISTPRGSSPDWLRRLRPFMGSIRETIRRWNAESSFTSPDVYALLKSRAPHPGKPDSFRCLAVYGLRDRIVISLAARHLREVADPIMHPGSVAFRTKAPPLTHHDAVERILRFRERHESREKWLTEVDIRGFFDVVSHDVARRAVARMLDKLPEEQRPDPRALAILEAYLRSYSFNLFGREKALERAGRQQRTGYGVDVPWPRAELSALGVDVDGDPVGIPQGGALSCFLANAILDEADWAVDAAVEASADEALYLRYCDDIVCLSPERSACARMSEAYAASLKDLKLPGHHTFVLDRPYVGARERQDGGFWKGKSKAPYRWGPAGEVGSVPWCAFVGYQIRYDGWLRLRPSSVKKEVEKHISILTQVEHFLRRKGQSRSKRQIVYRFRQRLRSIAVGTGSVGRMGNPPPFSWTQGFRLLAKHPSLTGQLRDLDRHRVTCIGRLARQLKRKGTRTNRKKIDVALKFEGFPFSYSGLAERRRAGAKPSSPATAGDS